MAMLLTVGVAHAKKPVVTQAEYVHADCADIADLQDRSPEDLARVPRKELLNIQLLDFSLQSITDVEAYLRDLYAARDQLPDQVAVAETVVWAACYIGTAVQMNNTYQWGPAIITDAMQIKRDLFALAPSKPVATLVMLFTGDAGLQFLVPLHHAAKLAYRGKSEGQLLRAKAQ